MAITANIRIEFVADTDKEYAEVDAWLTANATVQKTTVESKDAGTRDHVVTLVQTITSVK